MTFVLGGPAAIRIAVQALYLSVGTDPSLASHLLDLDRRRLRTHMIEFLATAASDEHMADDLARLGAAPPLAAALVAHLACLRDEILAREAADSAA